MLILATAAADSIPTLPMAIHGLAVAGLFVGLLTLVRGRRLLRPVFALIMAVIGGILGCFLFPALSTAPVFNLPAPYFGMAAGAATGLGIGIAFYRLAVVVFSGIALAAVGFLAVAISVHFNPLQDVTDHGTISVISAPEQSTNGAAPQRITIQQIKDVTEQVTTFVRDRAAFSHEAWTNVPIRDRTMMSLAACGGLLAGAFVGIFAPFRSTAAATALFGSALALPCALWLANALGAPGIATLNRGSALGWLVVWLATAALGFAVQVGFVGKAKE